MQEPHLTHPQSSSDEHTAPLENMGSRRAQTLQGMSCLDTSGNARIAQLMELVGNLSRAQTPEDVLSTFSKGMSVKRDEEAYISLSTRGLKPGEYRITRVYVDRDSFPSPEEVRKPWKQPEALPVHKGGFLGSLIRSAYPEVIHHLDVPDDPVLGKLLAPFGSLMAMPLFDNGEPLNWAIPLSVDPKGFTIAELEERILHANLIGNTVRNVISHNKLKEATEKIDHQVERIANIQKSLLPEAMPEIPGVELAATYETFDRAGGDYYDFIPINRTGELRQQDSPWLVVIADASGHGPAAAVMMAMLQTILHAYPSTPRGAAEVLRHANHHIARKRLEGMFITAFVGLYDPRTRRLIYSSAGHNPPVLKTRGANGSIRRLDQAVAVPLGVIDDVIYEDASITIDENQSLVMYTDGITEAMAPNGDMFGLDGLEHALECCTGEPYCVVSTVGKALHEHQQNVRPNDDQTLVIMKVGA